jgi:ABC-type transporter Mla MlaB component
MPILLDHDRSPQVIRLEGMVDVGCAAELKAALVAAMARGGATEIALAETTEMDVTAMQLLVAAERAARTAGVALTVTGAWPEALAANWRDAGFGQIPCADAVSSATDEQ